jgi:YVTN family beta-propeller protein
MTLTLTRVLLAFVLVLEAFGQVRPADAQPCPFVGTGGTLSTDQGGQGATPAMPVQAAVTVPISGPVCLSIVPISVPAPPGVTFLAQQVDLAVAQADPTNPPLAVFSIDVSVVPRGQAVEMYLNGKSIPPCLGGATAQNPDPCLVSADVAPDGDPVFSVLTVGPGSWTFGATPKPCETAAECDDKNVCTIDACVNARCFNDPAPDGTSCADQDVCNGEEICQKGACVPPASAPCSAGPSIAYLAAFAAGQLVMQPLAAGVPTRTLALDHPWGVAVNPRRPEVYVTERNGSSLAIVDGASGRLTARVAIPGEPLGVAASPDGSRAYVASYKGGLTIVDPVAQAVVTTVGLDGGPTGVAVHPDSRRVYVTNYRAGILTVVDDELHERLAEVHVGRLPLGVAVHPSGTKVYVANHRDGTVSVVGTVSNTVTGTFAVGNKPFAIAFDASGARAYVTNSRRRRHGHLHRPPRLVPLRGGRRPGDERRLRGERRPLDALDARLRAAGAALLPDRGDAGQPRPVHRPRVGVPGRGPRLRRRRSLQPRHLRPYERLPARPARAGRRRRRSRAGDRRVARRSGGGAARRHRLHPEPPAARHGRPRAPRRSESDGARPAEARGDRAMHPPTPRRRPPADRRPGAGDAAGDLPALNPRRPR